jgi:hypothetical protein
MEDLSAGTEEMKDLPVSAKTKKEMKDLPAATKEMKDLQAARDEGSPSRHTKRRRISQQALKPKRDEGSPSSKRWMDKIRKRPRASSAGGAELWWPEKELLQKTAKSFQHGMCGTEVARKGG